MAGPFDIFVIFADMRTGSNYLEASLAAVPGVSCHGEAFNPWFMGSEKNRPILGMTLEDRQRDPAALLARLRAAPGLNGFRFFRGHEPRVMDDIIADRRCAKIILSRNPLDSFLSRKIAEKTNEWKLGEGHRPSQSRIRFSAAEFEQDLTALQDYHLNILHALQASGQAGFQIGYEDLGEPAVLSGLARYLGLGAVEVAPSAALRRQNPPQSRDKLTNHAEAERALAGFDRFALWRTPALEPRRGPGVPQFVAARELPLLFMPLRAGPQQEVAAWLGRAGGGLTGEFTQKTLKKWLRDHPGHRAFTVLRHPLPRAFAALSLLLAEGRPSGLRQALADACGIPASGAVDPAALAPGALRALMLAALDQVKDVLDGVGSQTVGAEWASQAALVEAFAPLRQPDLLLREDGDDRLFTLLAPDAAGPQPEAFPALEAACDDTLEAAAYRAYQRDYVGFGFGRWRGSGRLG